MMKKFVLVTVAVMFGLSHFALAQAAPSTGAPAGAPDAPSAAAAAAAKFNGTKIGTLAVEQAIAATNEGQRDLEALGKKFEPKQNELKGLSDEIDSLKKQLNDRQDKLNDESREKLVKQIEVKQKGLDRAKQDYQEDAQSQAGEIENRILQKMVPIIQKYVTDNGYGLLLDTDPAMSWPRGPVILSGPSMDITQQVIDAYNAQSGVPAPAANAPAKPKPAATKPPATNKPAATTPPKQ
jgi:outer membrane protein